MNLYEICLKKDIPIFIDEFSVRERGITQKFKR